MVVRQNNFLGGIDQFSPVTEIPDGAVELLINGRSRHGDIEPIAKHVVLANAPVGIKQGLISVGNTLVLFVAGYAYTQVDGETTWTPVPDFHMSTIAYRYWTQAVPKSSMNFKRKADATITTNVYKANTNIAGTPQCIVVQDNINQPWVIFFDEDTGLFSSRVTGAYVDWQNGEGDDKKKEYVPIGNMMMHLENILYIVAPDYKSVYHSITGRPLDFMINVNGSGDKGTTEAIGGAATVSFSFDSEPITCIQPVNTPSSFIYATANTVRILTADYNLGIFGEPFYVRSAQIEAGIVNQDSLVELVGDYAFIDEEAVKSFNAVLQLRTEAATDIFSAFLAKMLRDIKQQNCSVVSIDNYALFNLDTIYGNVFVIYDTLRNKWCSVDITPALNIKKFAITKTTDTFKLYAISFDDIVYHLYGSTTEVFAAKVFTKTYEAENVKSEHKSEFFKPTFVKGTSDGVAQLTEYVDGRKSMDHLEMVLNNGVGGVPYPVRAPVRQDSLSNVDAPGFQLKEGLKGSQIQYVLQWDTDHVLSKIELGTKEDMSITSLKQKNA